MFWKKITTYNGSEEEHVYLGMQVLDTKRLLIDTVDDSFTPGESFSEELIILNDGIVFDNVKFTEAGELADALYEELMLWFALYGA